MNDKDKELLLRDLCGRLPYGVKCEWYRYRSDHELIHRGIIELGKNSKDTNIFDSWNKFKPYLFPLSSMTEEQKKEYRKVCELDTEILSKHPMDGTPFPALYNSQDYLNAHHFDYRGLIPMGMAIDATGKNIY